MAEWIANEQQIVAPGESIVFSVAAVPYAYGLIYHRDGSGIFRLRGVGACPYCRSARYNVRFGANIAVPADGTAEEISIAISQDGEPLPTSEARVTPAAVEEFFNVNAFADIAFPIWAPTMISVRNTSTQDILVENANLVITLDRVA